LKAESILVGYACGSNIVIIYILDNQRYISGQQLKGLGGIIDTSKQAVRIDFKL
jgi:hypothetical protein